MAPLEWSDEYRIGIPALDRQHEELFASVNRVIEAILIRAAERELADRFTELLGDVRLHFTTEERVMEVANYPGLAGHRKIHHQLFDEITLLMFRASAQEDTLRIRVIPLFKRWLVDHILGEDLDLSSYLHGIRPPGEGLVGTFGGAGEIRVLTRPFRHARLVAGSHLRRPFAKAPRPGEAASGPAPGRPAPG